MWSDSKVFRLIGNVDRPSRYAKLIAINWQIGL